MAKSIASDYRWKQSSGSLVKDDCRRRESSYSYTEVLKSAHLLACSDLVVTATPSSSTPAPNLQAGNLLLNHKSNIYRATITVLGLNLLADLIIS